MSPGIVKTVRLSSRLSRWTCAEIRSYYRAYQKARGSCGRSFQSSPDFTNGNAFDMFFSSPKFNAQAQLFFSDVLKKKTLSFRVQNTYPLGILGIYDKVYENTRNLVFRNTSHEFHEPFTSSTKTYAADFCWPIYTKEKKNTSFMGDNTFKINIISQLLNYN